MNHQWVSHSSGSTGQMVALDKVFKIRTFKHKKEDKHVYRIAFEMDTHANSQVVWEFMRLESAVGVIEQIIKTISPDQSIDPKSTTLYIDMVHGFA